MGIPEPPMPFPLKVAVGTPSGVSSTVWTISPHKDDIYFWTWNSGGQTKVSLHASGNCQWSGTEKWVKENRHPDFRNQDRHLEKWKQPEPDSNGLKVLCRLLFPATDLSIFNKDEKIRSDQETIWLPTPSRGQATRVDCLLSPPGARPRESPSTPGEVLRNFHLPGRGRLVVTAKVSDLTDEEEAAFAVQRLKMLQPSNRIHRQRFR